MKSFIKYIVPSAALFLGLGMTSCSSDLDIDPIDPNLTTGDKISSDALLNKCYANFAVAGNGGANGDCDIDGLDGGTTGFIRQLFNSNELTTDEAICAWGDDGIENFNTSMPDASHPMLAGLYNRLYVGITYCNQYLQDYADVDKQKTAECRFLRAFQFYLLMDGWGNVPFPTTISSDAPQQIKRADLFAWIESELKEIEPDLAEAKPEKEGEAGYGRVDKAAAWMLLARLYINAQVYTGEAKWGEAKAYAKKVIDSPYKLYTTAKGGWSAYQQLFMGDNGTNGASQECLFAVLQDGERTTAWGCTLFLMAGNTNLSEIVHPDGQTLGMNTSEKWSGNRMCKELVEKFFPNDDAPVAHACDMPAAAGDDRAIFESVDRTLTNDHQKVFTEGFSVCKFNNWYTSGTAKNNQFPDTDFFLMRAAEAYLIFAEADAREHGNTTSQEGTNAINQIRSRANATPKAAYSLDDICDEWSREFYFEGLRRPTLVRFNKYGGNVNYNWSWKGGVLAGRNIDAHFNIFAIPTTDMTANQNLVQNPGYAN
ncbi:MAG: RagB/SusD family nutrient uptake outer membrane protein [Prevotella sp.]|nr:RagB/SusD family nutrient uptake outer membrane protein [Prevotella sp.]